MVNKKLLLATRKDDSYVIDITIGEISAIEHGYDCDKNIGSICPTPFNTMTSEGYNVFDLRYFYLERNDRYWKAIKIMFNRFGESHNEIPHLYVAIKDQEGNYLQTPTSIGGYKEKAYFSSYVGYNKYLDAVTKLRVYLGPSETPPPLLRKIVQFQNASLRRLFMLNKELLLAQKQGLQEGEFLLTIGKSNNSVGCFPSYGYGAISPNIILYKGQSYNIYQLRTASLNVEKQLLFSVTGECSAKKCRITYKGKILESEMYSLGGAISISEFLYSNQSVKFVIDDFNQNVGKTVPIRIELF